MTKHKLLFNLLNKRKEFDVAKQEYINSIQEFFGDAISNIRINFQRNNKMYVTFELLCTFNDKYLLKFCNEFGFLAPTIEFEELSANITVYIWKFIKILE